jgi:hypothetical protein
MTYRDTTFCPFYKDCRDQKDCNRPLTDEVKEQAKRWWGKEGAPVAEFSPKPHCHRQLPTLVIIK